MNLQTAKSASGGDEAQITLNALHTTVLAVYGSYDDDSTGTLTVEQAGVVVFELDVPNFFMVPMNYQSRFETVIKLTGVGTAIGKLNVQSQ